MAGEPGRGATGRLIELIVICIIAGILIEVAIDLAYKFAPLLIIGAVVLGVGSLVYQRNRRW